VSVSILPSENRPPYGAILGIGAFIQFKAIPRILRKRRDRLFASATAERSVNNTGQI
jgi:hypothetical protein